MAKNKLPKRSVMLIELHTKNDTNGNPRRLTMIVNGDDGLYGRWSAGTVIAAVDHGYVGPTVANQFIDTAMRPWYDLTIVRGPTINVTPGEYRATLKEFKAVNQAKKAV